VAHSSGAPRHRIKFHNVSVSSYINRLCRAHVEAVRGKKPKTKS